MFRTKDTYGRPKYVSRSRAVVIDNRDPLKRGRIRVKHPLIGESDWIAYLKLPHAFDMPSINDIVYIESDTGEYEYLVAWGNITRGLPQNLDLPDTFRRNVPSNRGLYTPGGHFIEMDDGESNPTTSPVDTDLTTVKRGVRITTKAGNKVHIMEDEVNAQQYILLEDIAGNFIRLDTKNKTIDINAVENQTNVIGKDYQVVVQGNVNMQVIGNVNLECADIDVEATSAVVITTGNVVASVGGSCQVQAAVIELNGASGDILTTTTDPVVDTIFGAPTVGVPTVKSG
jgi:hypothetical protein